MLRELKDELYTKVGEIAEFGDRKYSVIDLDDMKQKLDLQKEGVGVGIAYGGTSPTPRDHAGKSMGSSSVAMLDIKFHVVVSYWYDSQESQDNKERAFDILDLIRVKLLGYTSSVARRGWELVAEIPIQNDGDNSTIFYMQTWVVRSSQRSEQ